MIKNLFILISLLFTLLYSEEFKYDKLVFTDKERTYIKEKKIVKVCVHPGLYPFVLFDDDVYSGISIEFFNEFAEMTNLKFKYVPSQNTKEYLAMLKNGKCDINPIIVEKQNMSKVSTATKTYVSDKIVLVTRIREPYINDLNTLTDQKIAIQEGAENLIKYVKSLYPNMNLVETECDNLDGVANKEFYGQIGASYQLAYEISAEYFSELKIISEIGDVTIDGSFGITNREPLLLSIFNKLINDIPQLKKQKIYTAWSNAEAGKHIDTTLAWQILTVFIFILLLAILVVVFLKKNNQKLKKLINSTIEGVIVLKDGVCIDANPQAIKLFGYMDNNDIKGVEILDFTSTASRELFSEKVKITTKPYEAIMQKKDGSIFPALVRGVYIDNDKRIMIATAINLTYLKKVEKKLQNLNNSLEEKVVNEVVKNREKDKLLLHQSRLAQMGEMISMIAHQWRQPLTAISSTGSAIKVKAQLGRLDNGTTMELADKILDYTEHLSSTIEDFRDFFKPNKAKQSVDYAEIVKDVLAILETSVNNKNISIIKELNSNTTFDTYANEIKQVLLNLIKNAEDALIDKEIEDPTITIRTEDNILIISDNGGGIPEDILPNIFDPYFSTKKDKDGTGLGLYMSKTIIEEHCEGRLSVSNDKDGAVFKIIL